MVDFAVVVLARLAGRADARGACRVVDWAFPDARLSDCRTGGPPPAAVLEPEEAVWAVKDAGSLTGRVGDLGRGLTKPVWGGEGGILVVAAAPCAAVVTGLLAGLVEVMEVPPAFFSPFFSGFLSGVLVGSSFERGILGVVGVLGALGAGSLGFLGDVFCGDVVGFVDVMGGGLEDILLVAFSAGLLPFLSPFEVTEAAGLFSTVASWVFFSFVPGSPPGGPVSAMPVLSVVWSVLASISVGACRVSPSSPPRPFFPACEAVSALGSLLKPN